MGKNPSRKICFIASFLPQKCGIATFTNDLIQAMSGKAKGFSPFVVAMRGREQVEYPPIVECEVRQSLKSDYQLAADYINFSPADVVSLQHEYGLFGGEQGSYLLFLLRKLRVPVVTTLHTVLDEPSETQRKVLCEIADISYKVVVMNRRGLSMLTDIYRLPSEKVALLPHGIPDLPMVNPENYKHSLGLNGRKIILTFGLISRNKGIEVMIKALPEIVAEEPSILYAVVGVTHPNVLADDGEEYRLSLQRLVAELRLENHVVFYNHFVKAPELHQWLCAADFYVTPYLYAQQLTSGTLAFALGSGKAIVSTPYWYAQELLADGCGRLVGFGDSPAIAASIIELLGDGPGCLAMRKKAYARGRGMTWSNVGASYWELLNEPQRVAVVYPADPGQLVEQAQSVVDLPDLKLDHLVRLTDDVGLIQHAKFIVPDRAHGYCTDDNARALEVMVRCCRHNNCQEALRLLNVYLGFVYHAQLPDGTFQNFVTFDRKFLKPDSAGDCLARAVLGLGALAAYPPTSSYISGVEDCLNRTLPHLSAGSLHGQAYSILGLSDYLSRFPEHSQARKLLRASAEKLKKSFECSADQDWQWLEDRLTWDNAALPHSLFVAAETCEQPGYRDIAVKACEFLLRHTYNGHHFSFIGNNGWFPRTGQKAKFDQQPVEAAGTVLMLRAAYEATGETKYLKLMRKAFDWFLGLNDLGKPLYDLATGGCRDGLHSEGVSDNQGAESLLSFLSALICVGESYIGLRRVSGQE